MLKKFILWFVVFGLSFLLADVWGSQEKTFFVLYFGLTLIVAFALLASFANIGNTLGLSSITDGLTLIGLLVVIGMSILVIIATWFASKLFGVNFFITYQIMTFGQCLCTNSKKED